MTKSTSSSGGSGGGGGATGLLNPIRFMQVALGVSIFFTVVYMGQFLSWNIVTSGTVASMGMGGGGGGGGIRGHQLLGETHIVLQGFPAAYKFVSEYDVATSGPLYLLFMSDTDANGTYWCPDCQRAHKPVMDVFARAPRGSRLAEIRVGPQNYWFDDDNEFKQNELFYIDYIPSLMRYDGGGNSSAMLNEQYTLDYALLEYVFRVPVPAAGPPTGNTIRTFEDPEAVERFIRAYDNSYPLFLHFVSGEHAFNGRLWCPYCDRAEIAINHYYNYTAPSTAVLMRVIVAPTYKLWKKKRNPFKSQAFRDNVVSIRGVPYLGRVSRDIAADKIHVHEFAPDFYERQALIDFFQDKDFVPPGNGNGGAGGNNHGKVA